MRVQDLFTNIPARLKFLKSDSAEVTQIKNVIKAMALQYPAVEWKVKVKGKLLYLWPQDQTPMERAQSVLDTEKLYEHEKDFEGFKAHIIFSDASTVMKVSRQIWIFVQNRWVQDRGLQAAVMEAYRSLLMHGQYPICYVSLTCPPDEVDVNIHPTKSQVKFVDSKKAFRAVHYCLREAIEKAPWRVEQSAHEMSFKAPEPIIESEAFKSNEMQRIQFQQKSMYKPVAAKAPSIESPKVRMDVLKRVSEIPTPETFREGDEVASPAPYWSQFQVIGQVDLTYIVVQGKDKMMLVDQHAAHERVAFEKLMKAWKERNMEIQNFLLPLNVDLDEPEVETLIEITEELLRMGIAIEQAGPSTLAVSSTPTFIKETGLVEALKKVARERLDKGGSFAMETTVGDIFATMACHSVIRAGQALSIEEMENLLKDMDEFPLSGFCPHGRSVSIEWSFAHLEKEFGRRV
ncbi:MAG: DNA mismatch repair protein MutL [Bdellovibrionales bacterium]|nr:DNA mismatch repair endonuclease MutL [Bdellovibrionales bacterium]NQZ18984.1 DNA mismatch repair protein MutL [Bdellovibrionales bacterium]